MVECKILETLLSALRRRERKDKRERDDIVYHRGKCPCPLKTSFVHILHRLHLTPHTYCFAEPSWPNKLYQSILFNDDASSRLFAFHYHQNHRFSSPFLLQPCRIHLVHRQIHSTRSGHCRDHPRNRPQKGCSSRETMTTRIHKVAITSTTTTTLVHTYPLFGTVHLRCSQDIGRLSLTTPLLPTLDRRTQRARSYHL